MRAPRTRHVHGKLKHEECFAAVNVREQPASSVKSLRVIKAHTPVRTYYCRAFSPLPESTWAPENPRIYEETASRPFVLLTMTPLKETLEIGDTPVSQGTARPKSDSGQLRSDAVSLDVPVKIHGSRVVEVVRGTTSHTEPFEEQTSTMIVFPLGGVLKMATAVTVGQAIVLTNLKNHQDAICRVVKVRTNPNLQSYVEVEFSHPQPGYWGVHFPSDGPEPPKQAAPPAVSIAPAPVAAPLAASSIPAPAPRTEIPRVAVPKVEPAKPEIRDQKPIPAVPVPPVAPSAPPKAAAPVEPAKYIPPTKLVVDAPAHTPAAESDSFSLDQLRGDSGAVSTKPLSHAETEETESKLESSEANESVAHEAPTFGRFAASTGSGEHLAARPAFGAGLEYGSAGPAEKGKSESKNGALIAVFAVLVAAAAGGGFYFLHKRPAAPLVAATASAPQPAQPSVVANSAPNPAAAAPVQSTPAPVAPAPRAAASTAAPPPVQTRAQQSERSKPAAQPVQAPPPSSRAESSKQNSAMPVPDMFGAMNAHPTAAVHAATGDAGAAPSIDSNALAGGQGVALPSNEPSPSNLAPPPPPPQAAPAGPVQVGGNVPPPKALSSPAVIYPEIARQAGVDGNVAVRVVIDATGKVTEARALSGPILLREAAVKALLQRRYAPSKLDGHPISVVMIVTIDFRR